MAIFKRSESNISLCCSATYIPFHSFFFLFIYFFKHGLKSTKIHSVLVYMEIQRWIVSFHTLFFLFYKIRHAWHPTTVNVERYTPISPFGRVCKKYVHCSRCKGLFCWPLSNSPYLSSSSQTSIFVSFLHLSPSRLEICVSGD